MERFWEKGYEGTGLSELEACTGLGRQSLYNAFGDKRELFRKALDHYLEEYISPVLATLRSPGSPMKNIAAVLDMWEARSSGGDRRGCLLSNSLAEMSSKDPEITAALSETLMRLEKGLYRALRQAQEAGELSEMHDPRALARLLTTLGQGLSVVHKVRPPAFSRDAIRAFRSMLQT